MSPRTRTAHPHRLRPSLHSLEPRLLLANAPLGYVDAISTTNSLFGWAYDPDTTSSSIQVRLKVDGTTNSTLNTSLLRTDVNTAFSVTGNHGFSFTLPTLAPGPHTYTVFGLDSADSSETLLATLSSTNLNGHVDGISSDNTLIGWAFNPDDSSNVTPIRIKIDGVPLPDPITTGFTRSDVNTTYSITGPHGFVYQLPALSPGSHTLAAYAIDTATGQEKLIGSATNGLPTGTLDTLTSSNTLIGWAFDPDSPSTSLQVQLRIDDVPTTTLTTNLLRTDVNSAYSVAGSHGFEFYLPTDLINPHVYTVYAVDANTGFSELLGTLTHSLPRGYVDGLSAANTLSGWAFDPSAYDAAIQVRLKIDGITYSTLTTTLLRSDVNDHYGLLNNHGFSFSLPTLTGTHTLTTYALDPLSGYELLIGSTTTGTPSTHLDGLTASNTLSGWAFDPASPSAPLSVRLEIDGTTISTISTAVLRSDINSAFSLTGNHGFSFALPLVSSGFHTYSAYVVDSNTSAETLINSVENTLPFGYTDSLDQFTFTGWAFDPNAPLDELAIRILIDNSVTYSTTTNILRQDVNFAYAINGNHGFSFNIPFPYNSGSHTFAAYAVDPITGQQVYIPSSSVPPTQLPLASAAFTSANQITGWAFDPDSSSTALSIRIDIDGSPSASFLTSVLRTDVNSTYSITGNHGFNFTLPTLTPGPHTIDLYALDLITNQPSLITSLPYLV